MRTARRNTNTVELTRARARANERSKIARARSIPSVRWRWRWMCVDAGALGAPVKRSEWLWAPCTAAHRIHRPIVNRIALPPIFDARCSDARCTMRPIAIARSPRPTPRSPSAMHLVRTLSAVRRRVRNRGVHTWDCVCVWGETRSYRSKAKSMIVCICTHVRRIHYTTQHVHCGSRWWIMHYAARSTRGTNS